MLLRFLFIILLLTLFVDKARAQESDEQDFAMLNAYDDFMERASDFSLSFLRYRQRGYDYRMSPLTWNGMPLENWQNGTQAWNILGNISSIAYKTGGNTLLTSFDYMQQGGRLSGAVSNRNYRYRVGGQYVMASKHGWSLAMDASKKWGSSFSSEGVTTDDYSFFASLRRDLGANHSLELSLLYAPTYRTTRRATTEEAYELTDDNLYNPAWGYQGSTKRSARESSSQQPVAILGYTGRLSESLSVEAHLSARVGEESYGTLMWQNAPNPYPDYYRYMPSYQQDPLMRELVAQQWREVESVRRIDYQNLYNINGYNSPASSYIFESRRRHLQYYRFCAAVNSRYIDGGVEAIYARNRNFKVVEDLMGGEYWLDIDAYVEQDDDIKEQVQSNIHNPNFHARVGDTFGYDYAMTMIKTQAWAVARVRKGDYGAELMARLSSIQYQREGFFEKENFEGNKSYGLSPQVTGYEYSAQAKGYYALGGRFRAQLMLGYRTMLPTPSDIFLSQEYRNATVDRLENSHIFSFEATADYRIDNTRISGALYYTTVRNNSRLLHFYDDNLHTYTHYWMQGIDERYMGAELTTEFDLYYNLKFSATVMLSDNRYTSNPTACQWKETSGEMLQSQEKVYYENLHLSGSPQCVGVFALSYSGRGFSVRLAANCFDNNYIGVSPLRRTLRGQSAERDAVQEKLTAGMTMDLSASKSFRFERGGFLGVYFGVNNLLNHRSIQASGYESYRTSNNGAAASRYYYALGINGYLSVVYRF